MVRLLNVISLEFTEFRDDSRPAYVIASHRWLPDGETVFQDVRDRRNVQCPGYQKVEAFAAYIRNELSPLQWLWVDTCCINKDSAAELSESINSMFDWYRDAELCLAYLPDVEMVNDLGSVEKSEWFTRGWTLQELLAPRTVIFVTNQWQVIGHKGTATCNDIRSGPDLSEAIARIASIPHEVLRDYSASLTLSVDDKLKWIDGRKTTRPEDMSYALFGILNVTPGANYGEKHEGARQRLLAAVRQRESAAMQEVSEYRKIVKWLSPPDPWTDHEAARQRHEPETGSWLLQHPQYQSWLSGSTRCLWVYGKVGCGKTILCSTVIEDVRAYHRNKPNVGQAIFYFAFSDKRKQTREDLLLSLVVQLGRKEPAFTMLRQAYSGAKRRPMLRELQAILLSSIASYSEVFLHLDGLDECPEKDDVQQHVLAQIEELFRQCPNLRMIATSRDASAIRSSMMAAGSEMIAVLSQSVYNDIQRYLSTELSRGGKFRRLDKASNILIEETLSKKADGMFRWVYCQLQELKRSRSTRPSSIKAALLALPTTLDETYERILQRIDTCDRSYALTLLQWVTFAQSPLSLSELAEAGIINPTNDPRAEGIVESRDRGCWGDTMEILADLIVIDNDYAGAINDASLSFRNERPSLQGPPAQGPDAAHLVEVGKKNFRVRLAHSSIREFLLSDRVLSTHARDFHLDPGRDHGFLAQSCLVYLSHYSQSGEKTSTASDLVAFPLLKYAAMSWFGHAALQGSSSVDREVSFLGDKKRRHDWLAVFNPDRPCECMCCVRHTIREQQRRNRRMYTDPLYCASRIGLKLVVQALLEMDMDIPTRGKRYGAALRAASATNSKEIVQILLRAGADVDDALNESSVSALHIASERGHEKVVLILIKAGADINAQAKDWGTALQVATSSRREQVAQMLIDEGADVNNRGGRHETALQAAISLGSERLVRMLIDAGAHVHFEIDYHFIGLHSADLIKYRKIVQMLKDAGISVDYQEHHHCNHPRITLKLQKFDRTGTGSRRTQSRRELAKGSYGGMIKIPLTFGIGETFQGRWKPTSATNFVQKPSTCYCGE